MIFKDVIKGQGRQKKTNETAVLGDRDLKFIREVHSNGASNGAAENQEQDFGASIAD